MFRTEKWQQEPYETRDGCEFVNDVVRSRWSLRDNSTTFQHFRESGCQQVRRVNIEPLAVGFRSGRLHFHGDGPLWHPRRLYAHSGGGGRGCWPGPMTGLSGVGVLVWRVPFSGVLRISLVPFQSSPCHARSPRRTEPPRVACRRTSWYCRGRVSRRK